MRSYFVTSSNASKIMSRSCFYFFPPFTCAIHAVSPLDHLHHDLSSQVPHVLFDLEPSGLDHEHIFVHCGQKKKGEKDAGPSVAVRNLAVVA